MAKLMANSDLAIVAGGTATWERCFLGLPTITITVAENQVEPTRELARRKLISYLGNSERVTACGIFDALTTALNNPTSLVVMSKGCLELVDGAGTDKVMHALLNRD
jgi:UDP-2,4-diacetamido-2,4,6-trideoxy-beta-L-altropyranose hydrolase